MARNFLGLVLLIAAVLGDLFFGLDLIVGQEKNKLPGFVLLALCGLFLAIGFLGSKMITFTSGSEETGVAEGSIKK